MNAVPTQQLLENAKHDVSVHFDLYEAALEWGVSMAWARRTTGMIVSYPMLRGQSASSNYV